MFELSQETLRLFALPVVILVLWAARRQHGGDHVLRSGLVLTGFTLLVLDSVVAILDRGGWLGSPIAILGDWGPQPMRDRFDELLLRHGVLSVGGILLLVLGIIFFGATRRETSGNVNRGVHRELDRIRTLLQTVLHSSFNGILILRAVRDHTREISDLKCILMNAAAERVLGISASRLLTSNIKEAMPCVLKNQLFQEAVAVIETGLPVEEERLVATPHGERWLQLAAMKTSDGLCVHFAEISDRKRTEEQLRHAAQHDTLTGLANRALLLERIKRAINRAERVANYHYAVLYLDFDRFKVINDSLGHEVGDQLLISIAQRLQVNLRAIDTVAREGGHVPARVGGDEFVILLDGITSPQNASLIAERLQHDLAAPHHIAGHEIVSTASIGVVTSETSYTRADEVLRDADTAMYRAKSTGKARHVVFDDEMRNEAVERLNLETALREAVAHKNFFLEYQPIVSLECGRIAGFEALVRWAHPDGRTLMPADFLPLAEEIGVITEIQQWTLESACRELARLQGMRPKDAEPLWVNVNLSKQDLIRPDIVDVIRKCINRSKIDPSTLKLEIRESIVMQSREILEEVVAKLKELGVKLVMDDFGTGYSSLSCLHEFPFDELKIDRSFVSQTKRTRDFAAIVHAVLELARNLGMPVVVEGVETKDQLHMLQGLGCPFGQGWLFSAPVSPEGAANMLDRRWVEGQAA